MRLSRCRPLLIGLLLAGVSSLAMAANELPVPPSGVLGVGAAQLTPQFWIDRLPQPDAVVLTPAQIAAENAELLAHDPSMHDLRALPAVLDRATVQGWIAGISKRPDHPLYDVDGVPVPAATLEAIVANANLDTVPATSRPATGWCGCARRCAAFPPRCGCSVMPAIPTSTGSRKRPSSPALRW